MTFLQLINEVLARMREPAVTGVTTDTYTRLIAALVNDAKRAVEDAADWVQLLQTLSVTTVDGTIEYTLTGTNSRAQVFSVVHQTNGRQLVRDKAQNLITKRQVYRNSASPLRWTISGVDSSDQLKLRLYPTPNAAEDFYANCIIPQADLASASDTLSVPWEPVVLRAYAMAIKERGEDQGQAYAEAMDNYRRSLSRALVLNSTNRGGTTAWQVL
jgi:hypothetical protein